MEKTKRTIYVSDFDVSGHATSNYEGDFRVVRTENLVLFEGETIYPNLIISVETLNKMINAGISVVAQEQ